MDYFTHLSRDRRLKKVLANQEPLSLIKRKNVHIHLCGSIMSQQLSTKVADVIHKRFLNLYKEKNPSPEAILATSFDTLRAIGLSNAKTNYVLNVARFAIEKGMDQKRFSKRGDEGCVADL